MASKVEFDDTRVELVTDLLVASPGLVTAGVGVGVSNVSHGSSYYVTVSTYGVPGVTGYGVGPMFRYGGLSVGAFTNGYNFIPQAGIGPIRYVPNAGVCSGFWCAGAKGAGTVAPAAIAIMSGLRVITALMQTEMEDQESWPLIVASEIALSFLPLRDVLDALSVFGIRVGLGPKAHGIKTSNDLVLLRKVIKRLRGLEARADAIKTLEAMLTVRQDPFVEAELRCMLDEVHVIQNEKGIPFRSAIEKNIERAVKSIEDFKAKYGEWLYSHKGLTPSEAEIDSFMAKSLYLARKLSFEAERIQKKGRTILKIRRSAPIQIKTPSLAARFVEAVALVYDSLPKENSGFKSHMASRTERLSKSVIDAAKALGPAEDRDDGTRLLAADAKWSWHLAWIQTMGALYEDGSFHRRRDHMGWIVKKKGTSKERAFLDRIEGVHLPEMVSLKQTFAEIAASSHMPPNDYMILKLGLGALDSAEFISRQKFPKEYGEDISILFDPERVKTWAARAEMVDGLYNLAPLLHAIIKNPANFDPQLITMLKSMFKVARRRMTVAINSNRSQSCGEILAHYVYHRPEKKWKLYTQKRTIKTSAKIDGLKTTELRAVLKEIGSDSSAPTVLKQIDDFEKNIARMKSQMRRLVSRVGGYRLGGFRDFQDLLRNDAQDSNVIRAALKIWYEEVLGSYERLKATLQGIGHDKGERFKSLIKEWDEDLISITGLIDKVRSNYERFNSKRVGAFMLASYLNPGTSCKPSYSPLY
jgi:hypothetical protein